MRVIIQKCIKCKENFSYIELLRSIWSLSGYKKIKCTNCNTEFKVSNISRLIMASLTSLPILLTSLLILLQRYIFNLGFNIVICYSLYVALIILLSPFIVRYKLME